MDFSHNFASNAPLNLIPLYTKGPDLYICPDNMWSSKSCAMLSKAEVLAAIYSRITVRHKIFVHNDSRDIDGTKSVSR